MAHAFKNILLSFFKRPDLWFFSGFLLTFPLTIRKVLFFYPINDAFNEYTGIYIYLSDIFLFLTIISWLFILCNKYSILSIFKCSTWNILESLFKKMLKKGKNEQLQISSEKYDKQNNPILNVLSLPRSSKLFHVEQFIYLRNRTFILLKKLYQQIINNYAIIFPLLLAIFSFLSILWANNKPIALFRSVKLFEFILLYFYIIYNVPRGTFLEKIEYKKCSTWNIFGVFLVIIIISGFIQSIIGFLQFFRNSSIGLVWLKESVLSPETSEVAKIIFDGIVHIRSYGLFPHPNIFGGFLIFSIIATLLYFKLFHVEQFEKDLSLAKINSSETNCSTPASYNVPRLPRTMFHACPVQCSTWNICTGVEHLYRGGTFVPGWNNLKENIGKIVPRGTILMHLFILIQAAALLSTFSKSAIIGLFIVFFYIFKTTPVFNVPRGTIFKNTENKKCSTWNILSVIKIEHFWRKVFLATAISILLFFIFKPDFQSLFFKSLNERITYLNVSRGTFFENPFFGTGIGQFVPNLKNVTNLETWQFQPVHNVFLLILNELGIFIFIGFIFFIYKIFHPSINVPPRYKCSTPEQMFHPGTNVPPRNKCSTPVQMFHPGTNVPRGTLYGAGVEHCTGQAWTIVRGRRGTFNNLNIESLLKGTLLALIFIMFFDHYLWDIQQGQIMFWIILGLMPANQRKRLF